LAIIGAEKRENFIISPMKSKLSWRKSFLAHTQQALKMKKHGVYQAQNLK